VTGPYCGEFNVGAGLKVGSGTRDRVLPLVQQPVWISSRAQRTAFGNWLNGRMSNSVSLFA
jgi:hypothetical protein